MRSGSFDMLRAMASRPASFDQACGKNRELRWTDKVEADHCQAKHAVLAEQRAFLTAIIGRNRLLGIASFPHRSLGRLKKTKNKKNMAGLTINKTNFGRVRKSSTIYDRQIHCRVAMPEIEVPLAFRI